ncbi:unnamed protein product, partial [Phaeothamnion confervicola]
QVNWGIAHLDLSFNEVSPRGVMVLAQALEQNNGLASLALHGNHIAFDGARMLVRSLNYWPIRRRLGLDNCSLGSEGAA